MGQVRSVSVVFTGLRIKESFQVERALQTVWDFVVDPHKIGSCLPCNQWKSLKPLQGVSQTKGGFYHSYF